MQPHFKRASENENLSALNRLPWFQIEVIWGKTNSY